MRRTVLALLAASAMTAAAATPALAQGRAGAPPRVSVAIGGGYQATTSEFEDRFEFELHREPATTRVAYPVEAGVMFDAGGGVRLWGGLGAGLAVSRFARDGAARTSTSLPHPFFLNQPRQIDGDADGVRREEVGIHVQAQYSLPLGGGLQLILMGGPSMFSVNQMMVNAVKYSEEYPYDTATFTGVDTTAVKGSATGFNAGVDLRWMFSKHVGAGVLARVARAQIDLEPDAPRTVAVDAGGTHVAAGVRFAF